MPKRKKISATAIPDEMIEKRDVSISSANRR